MSRLGFRVAGAFHMVAIGIAGIYLYTVYDQKTEKPISIERDRPAQGIAERERTYDFKKQALADVGGFRACFITFESSEGMAFGSATIRYHSSRRARTEVERKLRESVEIVEREDIVDKAGRKAGEKILATFAPSDGSSTVAGEI